MRCTASKITCVLPEVCCMDSRCAMCDTCWYQLRVKEHAHSSGASKLRAAQAGRHGGLLGAALLEVPAQI
jgi:hypothetical protein